jgi:hypothetical protein
LKELEFFESNTLRMYHQGIVVYETILPKKGIYTVEVRAHDYAMFFVDGQLVESLVRKRY